jgi:hypothetical protein
MSPPKDDPTDDLQAQAWAWVAEQRPVRAEVVATPATKTVLALVENEDGILLAKAWQPDHTCDMPFAPVDLPALQRMVNAALEDDAHR